ncbi:uncharacterized protein [Diabrotica undecimpunctata]|uniref:uncharacterized protein isoform X2 n=1 Tax=Diabrotica undecimpunctata TaxID=50387 RepID=UPI003B637A99
MTHPFSNISNDGAICEKFLTRFLYKEKPRTPAALSLRSRERSIRTVSSNNQNELIKCRSNVKQQNFPSPSKHRNPFQIKVQCLDHSIEDKMNTRPRSRSSAVDRDTWDQALKKQRSGDKISIFGNFDPLRTLHFLAKELQFQLQSVLPEDNTVQQMVKDMQYALKRIPPEIASTIHLQQAIESRPKSSNNIVRPEKLSVHTVDCSVQTVPLKSVENNERLQQIMEEGTLKLEKSCKHMERLCIELKNEKTKLEGDLVEAKHSNKALKKKILDLELENNEILTPRLKQLEDEKQKLETKLKTVTAKLETVLQHSSNDLKSQISELKSQKNGLEQKCNNLKHQIEVAALEREKFVAILDLRDSQINEIRSEMNQLQEVVNEQLIELHNNAFTNITKTGSNSEVLNLEKLHIADLNDYAGSNATISSIEEQDHFTSLPNTSLRDLQFKNSNGQVQKEPRLKKSVSNFPS